MQVIRNEQVFIKFWFSK